MTNISIITCNEALPFCSNILYDLWFFEDDDEETANENKNQYIGKKDIMYLESMLRVLHRLYKKRPEWSITRDIDRNNIKKINAAIKHARIMALRSKIRIVK